jgi:hypothetical protein
MPMVVCSLKYLKRQLLDICLDVVLLSLNILTLLRACILTLNSVNVL